MSLSAGLVRGVCHFGQYGSTWMSNMIFLCELTIVIPRLPCLFRMAKAVASTVELVNSVTSDFVNSFNFAMWASASKCFPIELVPCPDGWRRIWWHTIHMMPGLLVSSIPQCNYDRHKSGCRELFQAIGRIDLTFIEDHQVSKMICKIRSLKSRIKTGSFLEEIITLNNEVFQDYKSDMAVRIRMLGHPTRKTAESNDTVKQTAGSSIFTLQLQQQNQICETTHTYLRCCIQGQIEKTDCIRLNSVIMRCSPLLCRLLSPNNDCWCSVGAQL